jgi:hypothetical protein
MMFDITMIPHTDKVSPVKMKEALLSLRWNPVIWSINGFFVLLTVLFWYLFRFHQKPHLSGMQQGMMIALAMFSLQFEKNVATYWEGWCLLLVSMLAFERFLQSRKGHEKRAWGGLAILIAALSLDELGSIHERAGYLFAPLGFSGGMNDLLPFALPAVLLLVFTLQGMSRLATHRAFWLTLGAFVIFGSVACQEHLEHTVHWPHWVRGIRVGVEEGSELVGIVLLLSAVLPARAASGRVPSLQHLAPRVQTLFQLRPVVACLTLLGCVPLGFITVTTLSVTENRGMPAAWLPFMLLNITWMAAYACARRDEHYAKHFLCASLLALFFSLDQIIVFHRVFDMSRLWSGFDDYLFPCMALVCVCIPPLRCRSNMLLLGVLLLLSGILPLLSASDLLVRLIIPLQALGIFWVVSSGLRPMSSKVREEVMPI